MIDFSYFKLFPEMREILDESLVPLTQSMIEIEDNLTFEFDKSLVPIKNRDMMQRMKKLYHPNNENKEELDYVKNFILSTTITFAGYPNTKTKEKANNFQAEQVFYHGSKVEKDIYQKYNCIIEDNIISKFGKKGAMNSSFESTNPIKKEGISGGGVYKLVDTEFGFDRRLIGIGHTKKDKEHLMIGTNIKFCLDVIKKRLDAEN